VLPTTNGTDCGAFEYELLYADLSDATDNTLFTIDTENYEIEVARAVELTDEDEYNLVIRATLTNADGTYDVYVYGDDVQFEEIAQNPLKVIIDNPCRVSTIYGPDILENMYTTVKRALEEDQVF